MTLVAIPWSVLKPVIYILHTIIQESRSHWPAFADWHPIKKLVFVSSYEISYIAAALSKGKGQGQNMSNFILKEEIGLYHNSTSSGNLGLFCNLVHDDSLR